MGAQLAVYAEGELAVDLTVGELVYGDGEVSSDDRYLLFSATKPYVATCIHQLVEDGALDYDDRVREHWPEFAAPGTAKAEVTVRHVLCHQAGFPQSRMDARPEAWTDRAAVIAAMEEMDLEYEPGSRAVYHPHTFGWVLGELVRRKTGTSLRAYAEENVFDPLGMDRTTIGLAPDEPDDVRHYRGFDQLDWLPDGGAFDMSGEEADSFGRTGHVRRAFIPGVNGIGTARDMARFYACLLEGGELDGARIVEPETIDAATELQPAVDTTTSPPRRYGMGFENIRSPWHRHGIMVSDRVYGMGSFGAITGWGDFERGIGFTYVANSFKKPFLDGAWHGVVSEAARTFCGR